MRLRRYTVVAVQPSTPPQTPHTFDLNRCWTRRGAHRLIAAVRPQRMFAHCTFYVVKWSIRG